VRYEALDEARARQAVAIMTELEAEVQARLGVPVPGPLLVHLAVSDADFERVVHELTAGMGKPPAWALAVALPNAGAVVIRAGRLETLSWNDLRPTLLHELAHLATAQAGRLPRFLDEGLAMWVEGRRVTREELTHLQRLAHGKDLPTFAELARDFPPHAAEAHTSYLVSLFFVEWLVDASGPEVIPALLGRVARGETIEVAFERAFEAPLAGAEAVFRADLVKGYSVTRDVWEQSSVITLAAVLVVVAFARTRRRRREELEALDPPPPALAPPIEVRVDSPAPPTPTPPSAP